MRGMNTRRSFLRQSVAAGVVSGVADLDFLSALGSVRADDAQPNPDAVRFTPETEPLVRLLEETPREKLLEEIGQRIQRGLSYRELLAALFLAGIRNVRPRPHIGEKFHAVLVVNAAHLASL